MKSPMSQGEVAHEMGTVVPAAFWVCSTRRSSVNHGRFHYKFLGRLGGPFRTGRETTRKTALGSLGAIPISRMGHLDARE